MDQNQSNNDLQKAIDDITNTTSVDPVFSDPVAAPSSVPEGDTGELGESNGPFPEPTPEPKVEMREPGPEPIAPLESMNIPELNDPNFGSPESAPAPTETTNPPEPTPEPAPAQNPEQSQEPTPAPETPNNIQQVKEAALRDLVPILGQLNINVEQKFSIYKDVYEDLHDSSVLEPAYQAAKEIADDKARAEALLYLVESIDKM